MNNSQIIKNQIRVIAFILVIMISAECLFAQTLNVDGPVIKAIPFNSEDVVLTPSWIKRREELDIKFLKSLDADRLLHNFRVNAGIPSIAKPLEGWEAPDIGLRGHFVGHYLSAVSLLVEKYHDPELSRRLIYMISELYKCQKALGGGYLSAFPVTDFQTLETKYSGVWAPYYTYHKIMQGLLDVYTRTGNQEAFQMVTDMASFVKKRMEKLSPETIERVLYTAEANPPNEVGGMNDVLYQLYKVSKNPDHLALAKLFDRDWLTNPLSVNDDILSGLHSNTHLVLVSGFTQRYAITREKKYHDAAVNFWNMLISKHAYINGSSSGPRPNVTTSTSQTSEHWGLPGMLSNTLSKEIAESCVTHNTQKLTSTLFTWNPSGKYADQYMNTFYNAVLPTQNDSTGQAVYHLPLGSPQTKHFLKENDFRCCNGTCIEAFAALNSGIYYHDSDNIWVNLFIPSTLKWPTKGFAMQQSGAFPIDSITEFKVTASNNTPLTLRLFIPSWADKVDIYVNDKKQKNKATPGLYYAMRRSWKNNESIKLVFHYRFRVETMQDDKNTIAVFYGPTLLAFETQEELIFKRVDSKLLTVSQLLGNLHKVGQNKFELNYSDKKYSLKPFFDIKKESYGVYANIRDY